MGLLSRIREHAAVAGGNFASMFKEVEIPPLPAAVVRLVAEFNKPEPDVEQLTSIISADLELSAKVMRTVNSSMYGLRGRIKSVRHAITLLGLGTTKSIVLCHTMKAAVPNPRGGIFEHESFWTDSLLRALLARSLTRRYLPGEEDDAFPTMLLSDVALPVLLLV